MDYSCVGNLHTLGSQTGHHHNAPIRLEEVATKKETAIYQVLFLLWYFPFGGSPIFGI